MKQGSNGYYKSSEITKVKGQLHVDQDKLLVAWDRLESALDHELLVFSIRDLPECSLADLTSNNGQIAKDVADKVKKHGVIIIRNVLDKSEAGLLREELIEYMLWNGIDPSVRGRTFYEIYWSKAQVLEHTSKMNFFNQHSFFRLRHKTSPKYGSCTKSTNEFMEYKSRVGLFSKSGSTIDL
jgi:hypothetical protein